MASSIANKNPYSPLKVPLLPTCWKRGGQLAIAGYAKLRQMKEKPPGTPSSTAETSFLSKANAYNIHSKYRRNY